MSQNVSKMNPKVLKPFKVTSTLILPLPCFSCKNHYCLISLAFNTCTCTLYSVVTVGTGVKSPGGYLPDLRDTDKSRYLGLSSSIIVLLFGHWVHFLMNICHFAIFMQKWLQEGEKHGFVYAWADCYLQANTIRWHCAWLQVTWWTLCQWKGRKICIEW